MDGLMFNNFRKKILKWLRSVKNVMALLAVIIIAFFLCKFFDLNKGEVASWVQAAGAIVSIWAAWFIAHAESARAAKDAKRQELSRCAGVIGMLQHTRDVIENLGSEVSANLGVAQLRESLRDLADKLDRIDHMNLPGQVFVDSVFEVRKELNKINSALQNPMRSFNAGIHFRTGHGYRIIMRIDECLSKCNSERERIRLDDLNS